MHAFQDPVALTQFRWPRANEGGFPFLSDALLALTYLAWVGVWVDLVLSLAELTLRRRDL
jgi:hypothetical protein